MKKKIYFPLILIFVILMINFVSAWGPHAHNFIINQIKSENPDNDILKKCLDGGINELSFRAGAEIPDITVVYYFSEGGKNYKATHNWNFQQEVLSRAVTEDEKCFAYGISIHLIADSISHTKNIPNKIMATRVPNWLTHPLAEKKYDSQLLKDKPEVFEQSKHMLDAMYGSKGDTYIRMIEYSLGENIQINVKKEIDNLAYALDSFYEDAFRPKIQESSLFILYPYVDAITNYIHPFVGKWSVTDMYFYLDKSCELSINTFNNWGTRHAISPHGFSELLEADEKAGIIASLFLISLIVISLAFPLFLIYRRKKFRYAFLSLLLIPLVILGIAIIYIFL